MFIKLAHHLSLRYPQGYKHPCRIGRHYNFFQKTHGEFMRLSTLAALMILTTIMLSACSQDQMAALEDKGSSHYGREMAHPAYSRSNPAPENPATDFKYSDNSGYAAGAGIDSVTSAELSPPSADMPVRSGNADASGAAAQSTAFTNMAGTDSLRWQWPVDGRVSYRQEANGLVIDAAEGTPIRAAAAGEVMYEGQGTGGFGQIAILRHADGSMTSYAHAQEIIVSKGDTLQQGDVIGYVGRTGDAASPQLHFAMRRGNQSVNPTSVLPQQVASR
jgi:murein DD-endopeptidase MepM/ murein hydrolase activator NlpD